MGYTLFIGKYTNIKRTHQLGNYSLILFSFQSILDIFSFQVKNIEYSPQNHSLLTSAFDGSVHMWDLRNFTENNVIHSRVFFMDGLMRMKLTPDCSKMILCSTNGFLLVIHDLNLETLHGDLQNFKV